MREHGSQKNGSSVDMHFGSTEGWMVGSGSVGNGGLDLLPRLNGEEICLEPYYKVDLLKAAAAKTPAPLENKRHP